jgi:hypothetical protein
MKRVNNLFEKICSIDNLILADEKARKGKLKSYGVKKHDENRESNILRLHEILLNGKYKTSKYTSFIVYEPKEREIYRLSYFPDRIVHHAIMNILEPIWVNIFTTDVYNCIKGRGIHSCLRKLKTILRTNKDETKYCLKMDIKKFYPSIDHGILKMIIRKKIKDKHVLSLLDEIIDSAIGVPIGNYLSQYFSNLYLAYFDHWIKEEKKIDYYYRYCDDIVILGNNKEELRKLFYEIQEYMNKKLKLDIKNNWQIFPVESRGIDFLGYIIRHDYIKVRKSIKKNFCRESYKLLKQKNISRKEYIRSLSSYYGWLCHANCKNLYQKITNNLTK